MATTNDQESVTLSVFISSPGDLATSRMRARDVISQMSGLVVDGKKVILNPMLYEEHTPAVVGPGNSPQQAVDRFMGRPDAMQIYVGMFWTRMGSGTVIKDRWQRSGTRYEFDNAYKSLRLSGSPQMLMYRCMRTPAENCEPESLAEVEEFFEGFRGDHPQFEGFPQPFIEDDDFAKLLTRDIEIVARNILRKDSAQEAPAKTQELADLVTSVRNWLATFEDLFGKGISDDQERERDRLFRIYFRSLPEPDRPQEQEHMELRPRRDESLLDVFDSRDRRMVMVGERGTGKTFAMLRLMQDLTDRAFIKRGEPVPVFFNLSSWSEAHRERYKRPSAFLRVMRWIFPQSPKSSNTMDQWLEDQLVRNYAMQRKAARQLLRRNEIIFCLDGLDELIAGNSDGSVASDQASRELRDDCVKAINSTLRNHAVRMVLCCREDTYEELKQKPRLGAPLQTQMLTEDQVLDDLKHWPRLDGLTRAMKQSPLLMERARVALFLGMMRVAYQDMDAERILRAATMTESDWEKHLLDHYVDQCMRLAPPESLELNQELIPNCLSWMAQMPDNDFLLDDLQPSVLRTGDTPDGEQQWRLYRRFSITFLALSLMLIETIPVGLAHAVVSGAYVDWQTGLQRCLTMWGASAVILTPLYIAAFATRSWVKFGLCLGLAWALVSSVSIWITIEGENEPLDGTWEGATRMFMTSLPIAMMFFLFLGRHLFDQLDEYKRRYSMKLGIEWCEIQPIEPMNWSWFDEKSYWRGGWIGLIAGPVALGIAWVADEMLRGTVAAILVATLVTLFSGMAGTGVARVSVEPNQGIARSLRHALLMTAILVMGGSLCWSISYTVSRGWIQGLGGGLMGLTLGFAFFVFGGIPVIRQFCLGSILHQNGKLPKWKCWPPWKATVGFLNDLVRYKLLRRSAGGYMFRHQSLREYYRKLDQEHSKS